MANLFTDFINLFTSNKESNAPVLPTYESVSPYAYNEVISVSYDGEKNLGEMGPIKDYCIDYHALRQRSWQLYLDSPVCQMLFRRIATWVIGKGLRLGADPMPSVLEVEGIQIPSDFIATVEDRFKIFAESKISDYLDQDELQELSVKAFIDAMVGGDILVVQRVINGVVKIQLIDGAYVSTPAYISNDVVNKIRHGVELDSKGKVIAYHVRQKNYKWERVEAYSKNGLEMAFLVYGLKYRLDDVRGIPLISAVMETAAKLERYQEATLASAEESAKIALSIEHNYTSTGENPLASMMAASVGKGNKPGDGPVTYDEKALLRQVAATTNKMAINMPIGSKLVSHESKKELYFNDFFTVNIHLVCSTIGIPPEVALMKYDSNFSASRAALKDWEHTLNVLRWSFARQFNKKVYVLWLTTEILKGKVNAPGYINALVQSDAMILSAYQYCRFTGANVPHIDPLKEVNAERAKLGELGKSIPLTTVEKATEALNGGDVYTNIDEFADEIKHFRDKPEFTIDKEGE